MTTTTATPPCRQPPLQPTTSLAATSPSAGRPVPAVRGLLLHLWLAIPWAGWLAGCMDRSIDRYIKGSINRCLWMDGPACLPVCYLCVLLVAACVPHPPLSSACSSNSRCRLPAAPAGGSANYICKYQPLLAFPCPSPPPGVTPQPSPPPPPSPPTPPSPPAPPTCKPCCTGSTSIVCYSLLRTALLSCICAWQDCSWHAVSRSLPAAALAII
jgi:hypothetical protein